ncbi:MAG: hypothetical protein QNJ81_01995 [Acidimicrobiia bacterium]|nr:hypothetical protein [Acidimicrobiia bacterium]
MNLENRIRSHYEATIGDAAPADLEQVKMRGSRLRRRARAGTALLSVAAVAAVAVAAVSIGRSEPRQPDPATLLSDQPLYDQIAESWTPVPDPVDALLATRASEICPFDDRVLTGAPEPLTPVGPPAVWVIDQRGVAATIVHGVKTTTGEASSSCSAIKVDGVWRNSIEVIDDWPDFHQGSGGPIPDYVGEMRVRFPDGTEVTASLANGHYVVTYPTSLDETLTQPNHYIYMDSYTADGALISSEFYMSYDDIEELRRLDP